MSDITFHFGQFVLVAGCLLGSAIFGVIALLSLCMSIALGDRRRARAVAAMAGAVAMGGLILAALSTIVPVSGDGDSAAGLLLFLWLGLFLAGLGLVIWSGLRA